MKLLSLFTILLFGLLLANCGSGNETVSNENETVSNETEKIDTDRVAFTQIDSGQHFQIDRHGKNVLPLENNSGTPRQWENRLQILNTMCSKGQSKITSMKNGLPQYETPISVFSPDGAPLGSLEDSSWQPAWSPDGEKVAVACGTDENGDVVVVSDYDQPGSSEGWSRSGRGTISDQIEIFIANIEGNEAIQLTNNGAGEWLPRWFPYNDFDPFDKSNSIAFLPTETSDYIGFLSPIIVETNRNGKSEILLMSTVTTHSWQIGDYPKAQSPAWSKNGDFLAFVGGGEDDFNIVIISEISEKADLFETEEIGFPISWSN